MRVQIDLNPAMSVLEDGKMKFTDRYYHRGEMENNCINLMSHVCSVGNCHTTIYSLARDTGVPFASLYMILKDAFEDKTHSTLFTYAMKYGYDFKVFDTWNASLNQNRKSHIIDVVRYDWTKYKYPD